MKLFFAAPESGLPSALTALAAQVSAIHFFMKEVFAAPASGLPSLPTALLSQVSCAKAAPPANVTTSAASIIFLSIVLSLSNGLDHDPLQVEADRDLISFFRAKSPGKCLASAEGKPIPA